jgi:hypothetical protein
LNIHLSFPPIFCTHFLSTARLKENSHYPILQQNNDICFIWKWFELPGEQPYWYSGSQYAERTGGAEEADG